MRVSLSGLGELALPLDAQLRQLVALPATAEVAVRDDGGRPLCLHEAVLSAVRALGLAAAVEPRLRGLTLRVGGRETTFPPAEGRTASPTSAPSSALPAALELPPRRPPLILSPPAGPVEAQTASCSCAPPPRPPPPLAVLVLRLPVASAFAGGDELVLCCNDAVFSETDAARADPCPLGHAAFVAYRDDATSAVRVSRAHGGGGGAVRLELTYDLVAVAATSSRSKGCLEAEGRRVSARAATVAAAAGRAADAVRMWGEEAAEAGSGDGGGGGANVFRVFPLSHVYATSTTPLSALCPRDAARASFLASIPGAFAPCTERNHVQNTFSHPWLLSTAHAHARLFDPGLDVVLAAASKTVEACRPDRSRLSWWGPYYGGGGGRGGGSISDYIDAAGEFEHVVASSSKCGGFVVLTPGLQPRLPQDDDATEYEYEHDGFSASPRERCDPPPLRSACEDDVLGAPGEAGAGDAGAPRRLFPRPTLWAAEALGRYHRGDAAFHFEAVAIVAWPRALRVAACGLGFALHELKRRAERGVFRGGGDDCVSAWVDRCDEVLAFVARCPVAAFRDKWHHAVALMQCVGARLDWAAAAAAEAEAAEGSSTSFGGGCCTAAAGALAPAMAAASAVVAALAVCGGGLPTGGGGRGVIPRLSRIRRRRLRNSTRPIGAR